ncbi:MAG: hypothetical protein MUC38_06085 [Cyclobacteriaceae bacterium]|jgi:hypothetical protein|nr:hypothetical protein [Cyclobacteriaceae bacterium]
MNDKIQPYRQPMVTASALLLALILNFASEWITRPFDYHSPDNLVIGLGMLIGTVCLIAVIYRILRINQPEDKAIRYYQHTLRLFLIGVVAAFLGVFIVMFENYFSQY